MIKDLDCSAVFGVKTQGSCSFLNCNKSAFNALINGILRIVKQNSGADIRNAKATENLHHVCSIFILKKKGFHLISCLYCTCGMNIRTPHINHK